MSAEFTDSTHAQIKEIIDRLQSPIQDKTTLMHLLSAPLACLGLLPPPFRRYNTSGLLEPGSNIERQIPPLQKAILEKVVPIWEVELARDDAQQLLEQYFCPDSFSFTSPVAGNVALHAYSTILSLPLSGFSIRLLVRLSKAWPIDVLHSVIFSGPAEGVSRAKHAVSWEDCVRNVAAVPAKVANALQGGPELPSELENGNYFNSLSLRCEALIASLAAKASREHLHSITYLLEKLVNVGIFSPLRSLSPTQPSFFVATLPTIRARLASAEQPAYSSFWSDLLFSMSSSLLLQSIITSLFSCIDQIYPALGSDPRTRALVKKEAKVLKGIIGSYGKDHGDLSDTFSAAILGRGWDEGYARVFVCWAAGVEKDRVDVEALQILLNSVVDMWTNPEHIRHSLLSQHHYVTSMFLLAISNFRNLPGSSDLPVQALALSPPFITSVSVYISHLDPSVRRCGMLVAEEVARRAGKQLDFGDWDGTDQGKDWCRQIRELMQQRDTDADESAAEMDTFAEGVEKPTSIETTLNVAEAKPVKPIVHSVDVGYDSDDSLTGYASPSSSRSASPTPSELAEIEKDPSLNVGMKKVPRPVYLAQLGEMIRSTSGTKSDNEEMEARKIEVALDVAEELIRRKRMYGTELEENAVNLVHGLVGLNNTYELEGFDEKRQAALNALVACCPRKAAPAIIEEFFRNQYSTDQRFVMLSALALGAHELASSSFPSSSNVNPERISFPSKRLPPAQHYKYITAGDLDNPLQLLLEDISRNAIDKSKEPASDKVPELARERQLRIRSSAKITEVRSPPSGGLQQTVSASLPQYTEVAAEFFICPLINRFWLFLRDEQSREERTAHQPVLHRYRSAGTGLILNALVLSRFLETLTVLVHDARNAPPWLAVIAPDALELAISLGTRRLSHGEGAEEDEDSGAEIRTGGGTPAPDVGGKGKEAAVLTAALELALVVLDGCLDLDGGRSLGLEHTGMLLGAEEWAGKVFESLEKGAKVLGGGGAQEVKLKRAAAGVLLKVDELTTKWRRSMVTM